MFFNAFHPVVYIFIGYSCLNHYYNRGYRMLIFLIPSFLLLWLSDVLLHSSFSLIYLFFQCLIYIYVVLIFNITMDSQIIYSFSYIVWFCFFCSNYFKFGQWTLLQANSAFIWNKHIHIWALLAFWSNKIFNVYITFPAPGMNSATFLKRLKQNETKDPQSFIEI